MSALEILGEALRLARRGDLARALRMLAPLIPPGEDFGVEIVSTPAVAYYLDRGGLVATSKRVEESLPFMVSLSRRIAWDLLPSWAAEAVDICRIFEQIVEINRAWLASSREAHPYRSVASSVASLDPREVCGGDNEGGEGL